MPDGAKFATFRSSEDGSLLLTANTDRLSYVNKSQPEQLMLAVVNRTTGDCPVLAVIANTYIMISTACVVLEIIGDFCGHLRIHIPHVTSLMSLQEVIVCRCLLFPDGSYSPTPSTPGKARLVPLQSYHLSPALEPAASEPEAAAPQYTWTDVGRAFGLARWQKHHQRSTRLNVSSGSRSVAQSLAAAVEHVQERSGPAAASEAGWEDGLVPPQNLSATEPAEVYDREDVVPGWLYARLQKTADEFDSALKKLHK